MDYPAQDTGKTTGLPMTPHIIQAPTSGIPGVTLHPSRSEGSVLQAPTFLFDRKSSQTTPPARHPSQSRAPKGTPSNQRPTTHTQPPSMQEHSMQEVTLADVSHVLILDALLANEDRRKGEVHSC